MYPRCLSLIFNCFSLFAWLSSAPYWLSNADELDNCYAQSNSTESAWNPQLSISSVFHQLSICPPFGVQSPERWRPLLALRADPEWTYSAGIHFTHSVLSTSHLAKVNWMEEGAAATRTHTQGGRERYQKCKGEYCVSWWCKKKGSLKFMYELLHM